MNKFINKQAILEYVRTIIIALIIALFLAGVATACSKVIADHHAKILSKMVNTAKDYEVIHKLITIYKEKGANNPADYIINVRLGNLYELIFDYDNAEKQYNTAISKAPYGVYSPYFGLASVYLKQKKIDKAANLIKKLDNKNHKPLLIAKGDFYMNLGYALWQDEKYEQALKQYQIAFFFYKKVDSKKKELAIEGITDCYSKVANIYFEKDKIELAVKNLETALLYRDTPIINYKLAILLKDIDPLKSNRYIEKTYRVDPALINYDIYEEILLKLINHYYKSGQDIERDLYIQKLKSIKSFQKRYIITEDDIKINIKQLKYKSNLFKTKYSINVKYTIENTSKYDFNTLYIKTKLRFDNDSKTIYEQKLYSKNTPLKSRTESPVYTFRYNYTDKDKMFGAQQLWIDFYAGKKENMRKIPIYSIKITD